MGSQVEGLQQSIRNANDSISLYQTAEGALGEVEGMLQRIRELAVQSANGALQTSDREAIQAEVSQLTSEIDNISERTNFNSIKLFEGNKTRLDFQYGANSGDSIHLNLTKMDTDALGRQARYEGNSGVLTNQSLLGGGATLAINGTSIRDSIASDDTVSRYSSKRIPPAIPTQGTSAIAKAAAINSVSDTTGVRAIVGETRTDTQDVANLALGDALFGNADGTLDAGEAIFGNSGSIQSASLTANTYMEINGEKIAGFSFEASDSSGELIRQINSAYDRTGVIAEVNSAGELVLSAKDGRDISIAYHDTAGAPPGAAIEAAIGLRSGGDGAFAYGGKVSLQANETFEINTNRADEINNGLGGLIEPGNPAMATPADNILVMGTNREATIGTIDLTSTTGATRALDVIDLALEQISSERSQLGALQNRTESTINNLSQTAENLSAASSRIKDADFAQETAQLASHQIKQQAAVSMLAQVSQSGQVVLSLLQ
jgi:flagellin